MLPANTGTWIIKNPAGTYSYVGMVSPVLADTVPATTDDVMAGRAYKNPYTGELIALKFPIFESLELAQDYATARGIATRTNEK